MGRSAEGKTRTGLRQTVVQVHSIDDRPVGLAGHILLEVANVPFPKLDVDPLFALQSLAIPIAF